MCKKIFFAALFLISVQYALAQTAAPGGVTSGLKMWLKANTGVTTGTGNVVNVWGEQSGANITGDFSTQLNTTIGLAAVQFPPALVQQGPNFNPQVSFTSAAGPTSVSSNNAFTGNSLLDPYNNTVLQVINMHTNTNTGVWFKWQILNTSAQRIGNEINNGSQPGQLRFDFRGLTTFSSSQILEKYTLVDEYTNPTQSVIRFAGATDNIGTFPSSLAAFSPGTTPEPLTLGNEENGAPYPTTIDICEVLVFNRTLTALEQNKVESYLAVKYGVTLDQSASFANNYTSAGGTVIWNWSANRPFGNNITGIGRDDASGLVQRQSKSLNTAGIITLYNGTFTGANFPALNTDNTNNFTADASFELIGDNAGALTFTRCYSGLPPGFLRMNRVWKAQRTGTVGTITLAVKTTDVPVNTAHLLVSTDSAFTPANTTAYRLTNMNGYFTQSLNLPDGSFFTYASDSLLAHPTSNSPLCTGSDIQLNSNLAGISYSWTGPAGFTSTLSNPVIPSAQPVNSGVYTLNGIASGCPVLPGSVLVTVTNRPAPPVVTTPVNYCAGDAALPLSSSVTGSNLLWYTIPYGGSGTSVTPVPSTTNEGRMVYYVSESTNGCESIRMKDEVVVRYRPNALISISRPVICEYDTVSFHYYGNARSTALFDWKVPAFSGTITDGSGTGPYTARFDSAGTFIVRLQVYDSGCASPVVTVPVTVNPSPYIKTVVKSDVCQGEVVNVALSQFSPAIDNYNWDFDGANVIYGGGVDNGGPHGVQWTTPGAHTVSLTVITKQCPSRIVTKNVLVHPAPDAGITPSGTDVCSGDSVLLQDATTGSDYTFAWSPALYFLNAAPGQGAAYVTPEHTGYYGVTVTSRFGCAAKDSVLINTKNCCQVYFPTAFSPNGDGKNDLFRVVTIGHQTVSTFRVVNRWGQTVFETTNEITGWDGTFNEIPQEMGTYYYYIRYQCDGKFVEQKGDVMLVR